MNFGRYNKELSAKTGAIEQGGLGEGRYYQQGEG